ncbi:phosphoribosylanthranilate isomerase [Acidiphilium acidophilum]|uniref:N-(5'-phosphoribosyl)anthranilate isomerase n=1 Tax=Acidiphilium acidophilum TaxID=76588 RepID=A0AAW9DQ90_ACIAO|nr:phosphoribosylanthranilate isomerase [Acidiphilium acidophilum]MDX5930395.1 phosphoribosylanthranilate isomerase [Acidiphilium acidophilum]
MIRVKICGITTPHAYRAATEAGADWIGFNFFPRSPRHVTPQQAESIAGLRGPSRVGLFVEPDMAVIEQTLAVFSLDILQIYAGAPTCWAIAARFGLPVWRAVGVAHASDLPRTSEGLAGFVIEAKAPAGADRPGGNATAFDWSITRNWQSPGPWLLGGGLRPDNVATAVALSGASAVDVSSGVEDQPGHKSSELIRAFIAAAKADAHQA